jgi:hypothetical protein
MNSNQAKRLIVLAAIFTSGLVFYFLPSEIYAGNPTEFIATRSALMINLVFGGLIVSAALLLPVFIPADGWRKTYATLLGGVFLALWVSGVFLVGDFGEMDGASFDLGRHHTTLMFHSMVFLCVLVAACLCVWKWASLMSHVIAVIGAGLLIIGTFNFYRSGAETTPDWEPVNLQELARFSSGKNLLILVLDTFQSDLLQQIVDQDPLIRDELVGFRFYPDTLGVAPSTYLTMPAFHSGQSYDNAMALSEYYDLGVKEGSFLVELAENGYQVDLINPITGACPRGANTCKQQENLLLQGEEVIDNETFRLVDLGIMRVAPGFSKKWIFQGNSGPITRFRDKFSLSGLSLRVYQGNTVLEMITDNLWKGDTSPSAKFIHLFNSHPPYIFDGDCNFIGTGNTENRKHATMQAECSLRRVLNLLSQMKSQGVYENSMIILTADTGAGSFYAVDDLSSLYALEHGLEAGEFGRLIGGANPVLAIKFPGARGRMESSAIQAQLTDIPRTVCETLQACSNRNGINLNTSEPRDRQRTYNHYRWKNEYWGLKHIPGMVQYTVSGPLWLDSSWKREISSELPSAISTVNFSDDDNPEIFGLGWGHVETNESGISKRWSIAKEAQLYLPLPVDEKLTLEFEVLMAPGLDDQKMTVKVDGVEVGSRDLGHRVQFVTVEVPAGLVTRPVSDVTLEFSNLQIASDPDVRKVSVSFYNLAIYRPTDNHQGSQ